MSFEGLQMQWETWGHPSSYRVHSQSYNMVRCHHKLLIFCVFCWWQQKKNSHSLNTIIKCIWKISFSYFRKCYILLDSELPLTRCQPLNIQNFRIFCWLNFYPQSLTNGISKVYLPYHFLKERSKFFQVHVSILPESGQIFYCH